MIYANYRALMNKLKHSGLLGFVIILLSAYSSNAQVICNAPPENDFCRDAFEIDGTLLGNTCCGEIEGFNICEMDVGLELESGVWYYYDQTLSATLLEIENLNIEGGIGVEVYAGSCGSLTLLAKSDCTGFEDRDFIVPNCNGRIYIHVSTTNDGCGEFVIAMTEIMGCEFADTCEEITPGLQMSPISDDTQVCVSTCLEYSCESTCSNQSAWVQFTTDQFATIATISVTADFQFNFSVYRATDCLDLQDLILCESKVSGEFTDVAVVPSSIYFVEISLVDGVAGPLDICVTTTQEFIDCSFGTIDIIRNEFPNANPDGPFCPGETVQICYDLTFKVDLPNEGNGCQWLQGILPVFGSGWDLTAQSPDSQTPGLNWEWNESVMYNVDSPVLGLGLDANNNPIIEYGTGGLSTDNVIPGGWWYSTPAPPSSGCPTDGTPDNSWGYNLTPCGGITQIQHCFMMTAKMPQQITDCDDVFQTDLSINIFTFADGETGCYPGELACAGDTPINFEGKIDCSALVEYELGTDEICSGDFASVPVAIMGGYEIPIRVDVIDAGNTTGAKNWEFLTGSGLIPDQIINNGTSIETITYQISFHEPTTACLTPVETFQVLVHPEFTIPSYAPIVLCEGDSEVIEAPSGYDFYQWYDAVKDSLLSENEQFEISEAGFYRLEVTEDFCTAKQIIEVTTTEPLPQGLNVQQLSVCNNFIGTLPTAIDLQALQLNGVTGTWLDNAGATINSPDNVEFNGDAAGIYLYSFATNSAIVPCPDTTYLLEITVEECVCPSKEINALNNQCAVNNTVFLDDLKVTTEPGDWTITDGPDVSSLQILNNELVISPSTLAGEYTLTFTLTTSDLGPLCETTSEIMFSVFAKPDATITPQGVACNIDTGTDPDFIDLDDFNVSNSSGIWSTTETGVSIDSDNVVDFMDADIKDYVFTFTTNDAEAPCPNLSYPMMITVKDCTCPSVELSSIDNLCNSDQDIDLNNAKITTEDGSWTLTDGPDVNSISIVGNMMTISTLTVAGDYELTFILDDLNIGPDCATSESINFSIFEKPFAAITPTADICNEDTGTDPDFLDLDDLNPNNTSGIWSTTETGISIDTDNRVDFKGADVKDYVFAFTTNTAQFPCEDEEYITVVTVKDCTCPSVELSSIDNLCNSDQDIDLNNAKITTEDGSWTLTDGPDVNSISIVGNMMTISTLTVAGDYELTFILDDLNIGPDCATSESINFSIFEKPFAAITPTADICNEDTGTDPDFLDLDDLNPNNTSGIWSTTETGISIDTDNRVDFKGADVKDYVFAFTTNTAQFPCEDEEYITVVTVKDCTCPSVEIMPLDDICLEVQSINLNDLKVTIEAGSWVVTDGPDVSSLNIIGAQLEINDSAEAGIYTIQFELIDQNIGPDCMPTSDFQFEVIQKPFADIEPQVVACNENTGAEPDFVDLDDLNLNSIAGSWSSVEGLNIDSDNVVSFAGQDVQNYEFVFTTATAMAPCLDESYSAIVTVKDCSCPSLVLMQVNSLCQDDQMFNLNDLIVDAEAGTWTIVGGIGNVPTIQNQMLVISENTEVGDYMLTYTLDDQNLPANCQTFDEIPFTINSQPEAVILESGEVCNKFIGSLVTDLDLDDLFVSGSDGDWVSASAVISIDNDNAIDFTDAPQGIYEFIYTTNTAVEPCVDVAYSAFITVNDCVCPEIELAAIDPLCNSNNTIDLSALQGSSDSGEWTIASSSGTAPPEIFNQSEVIINENTQPGSYILTYTLLESNIPSLCITNMDVVFDIVAQPSAEIIGSTLACNINGSPAASDVIDLDDLFLRGDSGDWTTSESISINSDNTISFNGETPGDYLFVYTTNTAQFPCVDQEYELTIIVENCICPPLAFASSPSLCNDNDPLDLNTLLLNGVGAGSWEQVDGPVINGIDGVSEFVVSMLPQGEYQFEYTLSEIVPSGCDMTDVVSITINQTPELTVTPDVIVCNQNSSQAPNCIDLNTLMSGDNGSWIAPPSYTGDFSNIGNVCFDGLAEGSQFLFSYTTNTAIAPCINKTESIQVSVIDCSCPNINVNDPSPLCSSGDMINLSDLETTGTIPGSWSFVSGPENVSIGNTEIFDAAGFTAGFYIFQFTPNEMPEPMCPQVSQVAVEVIVPLSAGTGNTVDFCQDTDVQLNLFNLLDNAEQGGSWTEVSIENSLGSAFDSAAGTFAMMGQMPGTYEFKYEHAGFEPCPDASALITIIILENPIADAGQPMILTCSNMSFQLGGPDLSMGPRLVYKWTELSGKSIEDPTAANPTVFEAGTYKVVVTDIIFGCESEGEVVIAEELGFPNFDTEILPFDCENNEGGVIVVQNSTGGNGDYIYTIDDGVTWTEDATFSGLPPGTYTITLQDGNGCESTVSGLEIRDRINLNLDLGDDVEITYGENYYPLQVQTSALPEEIDSVIWTQDNEIVCEGDYDTCSIIEVDPEGVNTFCVRVVDINGCEETECVVIREILEVNVYIANVFTPASDDFNNKIFIQTDENIEFVKSMRIFDRWGSQVFEGEEEHLPNDPNQGWDGTWKNGNVQEGVFTYHVVVVDALNSEHSFAGTITLIR